MLRSLRPSLHPRKELPRTEGTATPAHEKEGSESESESDVKRDKIEQLEAIPQAQDLFDLFDSSIALLLGALK